MSLDYEKLYIKFYKSLFSYAYRLTKNKDDADDIVQEAFLRIIQKQYVEESRTDGEQYNYIQKVIKNIFLDNKKKDQLWLK